MVRLLGNTKISLLSFVYCFCIVLYAGLATRFTRDLGNITTIGNAVGLGLTFLTMIAHKITLNRKFFHVIVIFLIYGMITTVNQGRFSFLWLSKWPILFLIAYVLCHDLKGKLFVTIETIILILSVISLALWAIQIVSPGAIHQIVKTFEFSTPYSEEAKIEGNMLVFTLMSNYEMKEFFGLLPRNAGFAWEPGAFGSYICIGLFCNMLRRGLSLKGNYPFIIMLIALLSTQSTTAISAFGMGLTIWLAVDRKVSYAIWIIPLVLWTYSLPFVSDKAINEYNNAFGFSVSQIDFNQDLSRMQSFILSWEEFLHHPILGLGGDAGGSWLNQQGYDVPIFSGLGELLSRYGLIMSCLFFWVMYKSCTRISRFYHKKGAYAFIGIFVFIMFAFNNWNAPLFIVFWLFSEFGDTPISSQAVRASYA